MCKKKLLFHTLWLLALTLACQKKPLLAPSGDLLSPLDPPPMGATTYNDELKRELVWLEDLLTDKVDPLLLNRVKSQLLAFDAPAYPPGDTSDEAALTKLLLAMPELIHTQKSLSPNRKDWLKAKLFFLNRRFADAAMLLRQITVKEPDFIEARNWLARSVFFLGNPDLAVRELDTIIKQANEKSPAGLDALYLKGAISFESNDRDAARLNTGIKAWQRYLTLANPDPAIKQEIDDGLRELNARLKGETITKIGTAYDPFAPKDSYSAEKNNLLRVFAKDELLLALELSDMALKKAYDKDIATIKARSLFKSGRIEEAIALFKAIVEKDEKYAPGHHYRGMAFMMQGKPNEAVASWQKAVAVDPDYAKHHDLAQRIAVAKNLALQKIDSH